MHRALTSLVLLLLPALAGCTCTPIKPAPQDASPASPVAASTSPSLLPCPGRTELAPGLWAERHRPAIAPAVQVEDACLTLVRADPARFQVRLLAARREGGGRRKGPAWASAFGLAAVINASMYEDDDNSTGLLVSADEAITGVDNPHFGGFFAFDPVDPALPQVAVFGRPCTGFDLPAIRRRYRSIVQNYRLLDCDGKPIPWKDEKIYSAAVIGLDVEGRVVFLVSRAPYRMTDLATVVASPEVGLRAALYVEGGPEATLYARAGERTVALVGSYETGFKDSDDNADFWPLPNVLGVAPR
jgi:hypothetical protein